MYTQIPSSHLNSHFDASAVSLVEPVSGNATTLAALTGDEPLESLELSFSGASGSTFSVTDLRVSYTRCSQNYSETLLTRLKSHLLECFCVM